MVKSILKVLFGLATVATGGAAIGYGIKGMSKKEKAEEEEAVYEETDFIPEEE